MIVERRVVNHRIAGAPIECRGVLADYRAGSLTLYTSTQVPHFVRLFMALLLGLGEDHVRVIAPEVGGGFGQKLQVYGEELFACWASRKLGRPIKWIETRSENLSVAHQGRDQISQVKMGAKRDGTITAFHVKILADFGAYNMILTPLIPSLGAFVMGGCYKIPNVQTDITGVFTNKCPTDAIRGAGRPEATQMIEVTLDQLAHELGMDPLEVRRKNFIPKEDFPAAVATGVIYDSGDYHKTLDKLMEHVDVAAFRAEQEQLRAQGIYRGIGFCTWTEICGLAPSRITGPAGVGVQAGLWESAMIRVHNTGAVTVYTGTSPHGQGLETAMAQIVADKLGVDPVGGRGHPRRHVDGAGGAQHLRVALAGHRRRGGGQGHRQGGGQGQGDRGRRAGGRARGHRGRRRQVLGPGIAGQGHGAGRRGRRRLHRRGPGGHGARAGGDHLL